MADMLIAQHNATVATVSKKGRRGRARINKGSLYRSDDPIVQGREHLFRVVEQATAEPGEKRSIGTRRSRKSEPTKRSEPAKAAEPTPIEDSSPAVEPGDEPQD